MFLPQKPYIPLGTLAAALCYPNGKEGVSEVRLRSALRRVNLEAFIHSLNVHARWDKTMSLGQQQRLAFARLLIHRPNWVFLDEATSALDEENETLMMSIFDLELGPSALVSVGYKTSLKKFHQRTLNLSSSAGGGNLKCVGEPIGTLKSYISPLTDDFFDPQVVLDFCDPKRKHESVSDIV